MPLCPRHRQPLELVAAPVGQGWVYQCPVRACDYGQLAAVPEPTEPRQPKIPGLGRMKREQEEIAEGEGSELERRLLAQLRRRRVPEPIREFAFSPVRAWRVDMAWPGARLAVEVEGGVWTQGRHNRALGFIADTHKYNALAISGWTLLRYAERDVRNGTAAREIALVLGSRLAVVEGTA